MLAWARLVAVFDDDFLPKSPSKHSGSNLPHDFCLLGDSAAIPGVSRPSMQYAHRSSQLLRDEGGLGRGTSEELEFTTAQFCKNY